MVTLFSPNMKQATCSVCGSKSKDYLCIDCINTIKEEKEAVVMFKKKKNAIRF